MRLLLLALSVSGMACHSASFLRSDDSFAVSPRVLPTDVFTLHPPLHNYRAVGVIRVELSDATEADFIAAAVTEARDVGCDVLVDRRLPSAAMTWLLAVPGASRVRLAQHDHGSHGGGDAPRSEPSATPGAGSSGSSDSRSSSGGPGSSGKGDRGGVVVREYECGIYVPNTKPASET